MSIIFLWFSEEGKKNLQKPDKTTHLDSFWLKQWVIHSQRHYRQSFSRSSPLILPFLLHQAVALDNDSQFVYSNNGMLSSTAPSAPESLHYSSIDFTNTEPPSGEIRGIASLTSEYATVQHRPAGATDTENNTSTSETEPKKQDMTAEIKDTSSPASEDVFMKTRAIASDRRNRWSVQMMLKSKTEPKPSNLWAPQGFLERLKGLFIQKLCSFKPIGLTFFCGT